MTDLGAEQPRPQLAESRLSALGLWGAHCEKADADGAVIIRRAVIAPFRQIVFTRPRPLAVVRGLPLTSGGPAECRRPHECLLQTS